MIVKKDFLKKIKDFGLNSYEAKIWVALLSRGVSTARELSDMADVPRSRSYDVLESLEKKGFVMMKIGKPIKYIAIPPEEVMERVKKRIVQEAEEKTHTLAEIEGSDILKELNILHKGGIEMLNPSELSSIVKGRQNIYNHLGSRIKRAKSKLIIATTPEGLTEKARVLAKHFKKAKENGVEIKILTQKIPTSRYVDELSKIAKIKENKNVNTRFVVIDDKELMFTLTNNKDVHSSFDTCVWVNTPFFSKTMSQFFEGMWKV